MFDIEAICKQDGRQHRGFSQTPEMTALRAKSILYPPAINGTTILDIACGIGAFGKACLDLGASRYVGIDINEDEIDKGREYFKDYLNVELRRLDLKDIETKYFTGLYDTVILAGILPTLPNPFWLIDLAVDIEPEFIILESTYEDGCEGLNYRRTSTTSWTSGELYTIIDSYTLHTYMAFKGYTPLYHSSHDISEGARPLHKRYTVTYQRTVKSERFLTDDYDEKHNVEI